jgi:porin
LRTGYSMHFFSSRTTGIRALSMSLSTRCLLLATVLLGLAAGALPAQQRGGVRWGGSSPAPGAYLGLGYAADAFMPVRGGLSGNSVAMDNLDLVLLLNLDALLGLQQTSLQVHVQSNRGGSVSSEVGDLQGISNLEAPSEWRLYEAWIEHQIVPSRLSILAGVYDINAEFDVIPAAGDFLNGSFGFGPEYSLSGDAGPSTYPTTGLAGRVKVQPTPSLYGLLGVSNANPDRRGRGLSSLGEWEGALLSFEAGYTRLQAAVQPTPGRSFQAERRGGARGVGRSVQRRQRMRIGRGRTIEELGTKVAIGGWAYSRRFQAWNPAEPDGRSWGLYALGEQMLRRNRNGTGGLSGFVRGGTAADAVNRLDLFLGGGFAYRGAWPGRPDDVAALGIAHAQNGTPFLRGQMEAGIPMERGETVLELTYRAQVGRFFVVQPDLQWVMNPGMDPGVADALVFGLRGHLLLELPRSG